MKLSPHEKWMKQVTEKKLAKAFKNGLLTPKMTITISAKKPEFSKLFN